MTTTLNPSYLSRLFLGLGVIDLVLVMAFTAIDTVSHIMSV